MEETGILENPTLLGHVLPHFEPGLFRDLTTASLSPRIPASRTRRKPKARSSKIENCHAPAVFRNRPGRAQPDAIVEAIPTFPTLASRPGGPGFTLRRLRDLLFKVGLHPERILEQK